MLHVGCYLKVTCFKVCWAFLIGWFWLMFLAKVYFLERESAANGGIYNIYIGNMVSKQEPNFLFLFFQEILACYLKKY